MSHSRVAGEGPSSPDPSGDRDQTGPDPEAAEADLLGIRPDPSRERAGPGPDAAEAGLPGRHRAPTGPAAARLSGPDRGRARDRDRVGEPEWEVGDRRYAAPEAVSAHDLSDLDLTAVDLFALG